MRHHETLVRDASADHEEPRPRPCPPFAGLPSRRAPGETLERAHRATKRTWRDRRLAAKLDELLGPVDAEEGL